MKHILFALALLAATPAGATTGLLCSTTGEQPISLALVVSHTAVPSVVSSRLTERGRQIAVATSQSWFDEYEVRVDLVDRNAIRHEARLSARWKRASRSYDGTLWRNGKRHWIRCRES